MQNIAWYKKTLRRLCLKS